jgi:hypothetical protein
MDTTNNLPTGIVANCGTPLATIRDCVPTVPHCVRWFVAPWGPISTECGPGIHSREVTCFDMTDGVTVDDSSCLALVPGLKPVTSEAASKGACYTWQVTEWSGCSTTTCGVGVRTRTVTCRDITNNGPSINANCEVKVPIAPIGSEPYEIARCCNWLASNWNLCSPSCSFGTRTRTYSCQDTLLGTDVPFYNCGGAPPSTIGDCIPPIDIPYCADNTLATLVPSVGSLVPTFSGAITFYTVDVSSIVSSVTLSSFVNQMNAVIAWSPPSSSVSNLVYGAARSVSVTVTSQSGSPKTYLVSIRRGASNNALLASMVPTNTLAIFSPAFVSTLQSYRPP